VYHCTWVFLVAALCLTTGCSGRSPDAQPDSNLEFHAFTFEESRFKILMPGHVQRVRQDLPAGKVSWHYAVITDTAIFAVDCRELQDRVTASAEATNYYVTSWRDALLDQMNGRLSRESKVMLPGGHAGIDVTAQTEGGEDLIRLRIFVIGGRSYFLSLKGEKTLVGSEAGDHFLNSFEVLP